MKSFDLGTIVVSEKISDALSRDPDFSMFVFDSLMKYTDCNWGKLCDEDKQANDLAVKHGDRILGCYLYLKTREKIWIITEADRQVTTIIFPQER